MAIIMSVYTIIAINIISIIVSIKTTIIIILIRHHMIIPIVVIIPYVIDVSMVDPI